jgi:TnpA family transposase
MREGITNETNKVESFHEFSQWLSFGNNGKILDNDPIEMEKRVKFNQLIANCVMLQNVLDMSQALRELIEEGYPAENTMHSRALVFCENAILNIGQ